MNCWGKRQFSRRSALSLIDMSDKTSMLCVCIVKGKQSSEYITKIVKVLRMLLLIILCHWNKNPLLQSQHFVMLCSTCKQLGLTFDLNHVVIYRVSQDSSGKLKSKNARLRCIPVTRALWLISDSMLDNMLGSCFVTFQSCCANLSACIYT